jgi:hypothetical protein
MCLRRAPEKYIAGAALDRADINLINELLTITSPGLFIFSLVLHGRTFGYMKAFA